MRPARFVPAVERISPDGVDRVPGLEAVISHWTEGACSAEEWFRELDACWGTAGFAMRRGDEVQGFVAYGPRGRLPHAGRYPVGPLDEDAVLLAYVGGDPRVRRHLLVRSLKDLRLRGEGRVEAIASDFGLPRHVPTGFLLESGWEPVRQGFRRGTCYTLARTDLGSTVEVGELARGLIGRVKLPTLKKAPNPAPGAFARVAPARERVRTAGSRS